MDTKKMLGEYAANLVSDGMLIGLGSGTTVNHLIEALGERVKDGLSIRAVSSSEKSLKLASKVGIPVVDINEVGQLDLTIDGANEIDRNTYHAIKGGGGSLLYEKIVTAQSKKLIWIVDENKMVDRLGTFHLPVEVIPFGSQRLFDFFNEQQWKPVFRKKENGEIFVTDGGHWIIDLHLGEIEDPVRLATTLKSLTGVVEHGLFIDCVNTVLVAKDNKIEVLKNQTK